jgi:D-alanine-D-alanine ligase-like ATP-grasp enzyme
MPQIKRIMADTMRATSLNIDSKQRDHCFEIYGYDFMMDTDFKLYLIEVNTNPCLETPT